MNFKVTITNPITEAVDISDSNGVLTIVDHSNYDDAAPEAGHSQSDFSDFRKMRFDLPSGTSYLFSSFYPTDGDVILNTPAGETLPISTLYDYTTGDGIYKIYLYSLPTYNPTADYLLSTAPIVYYDGSMWKLLQDATGQTPVEGAYWTEIFGVEEGPGILGLSSKYRLEQRFVITSEMKEVWARRIFNSNCINNKVGCRYEDLFRDPEWVDSVILCLIQEAIPVLMKVDAWVDVQTAINTTKNIAAKYD